MHDLRPDLPGSGSGRSLLTPITVQMSRSVSWLQRTQLAEHGLSHTLGKAYLNTILARPFQSCKGGRTRWLCINSELGKGGASGSDPDIITRIFGRVLGKNALDNRNPGGMRRMNPEEMHELYPATTTEFAQPLQTDDENMAIFRPLLAKTRLEKVSLRMAYWAADRGWQPKAFHSCCDGYGAAVVLAETVAGAVIGGYNPQGWIGLSEDRDSNAAFLFTWPDGNTSKPAIKLPKVGGPNLAVLDGSAAGIQFGAEDLTIGLQPGRESQAKSRLGSYYAKLPSGGRSLFAASEGNKTELVDLKVFVAEGPPEEWTLDGIVWKSKQGS